MLKTWKLIFNPSKVFKRKLIFLTLTSLLLILVIIYLRGAMPRYSYREVTNVTAYNVSRDVAVLVSAPTDAGKTTWVNFGGSYGSLSLRLNLPNDTKPGKLVAVFPEALSDTSANIEVSYKLLRRGEIVNSGSEVLLHKLYWEKYFLQKELLPIDQVDISFTSPQPIQVSDVFIYARANRTIAGYLLNALTVYPRSLISYLFYSILFLLTPLTIGAAITGRLRHRVTASEYIAISFLVGFLSYSLLGLSIHALESRYAISPTWWLFLYWLCFGISSAKIFSQDLLVWKKNYLRPMLVAVAYLVFVVCWFYVRDGSLGNRVQAQNDLYFDNSNRYQAVIQPYQSDQIFPYNNAKQLYHANQKLTGDYDPVLESQLLQSRPQLYALFSLPFLKAFGDRYFIFSALSISWMPIIIVAGYLLASLLARRSVALVAGMLLPMNYYLLFLANLTQIKFLTVILVGFYYYFVLNAIQSHRRRYILLSILTGSIMLMIHYYTGIYLIGAVVLVFLTQKKEQRVTYILSLLTPLLVVLGWLLFVGSNSGAAFISSVLVGEKPTFLTGVVSRYENIVGLFAANPFPQIWDRTIGFYKLTLPGMTTLSVLVLFILGLKKYLSKLWPIILSLVIIPVLLTFAGIGSYTLFGIQLYFVGLLPLIYGIALMYISGFNSLRRLILMILIIFEWLFILCWVYRSEVFGPLIINYKNNPALVFVIIALLGLSLICMALVVLSSAQFSRSPESKDSMIRL